MPKQYEPALLEVEAKKRLEQMRDQLSLSSLSATVYYLIDNLPADKSRLIPGPKYSPANNAAEN